MHGLGYFDEVPSTVEAADLTDDHIKKAIEGTAKYFTENEPSAVVIRRAPSGL